jgi:hypothetical protein
MSRGKLKSSEIIVIFICFEVYEDIDFVLQISAHSYYRLNNIRFLRLLLPEFQAKKKSGSHPQQEIFADR